MALEIEKYNRIKKVVFVNEPAEKVGFKKVVELGDLPNTFKVLGVHYFPDGQFGEQCFVCIEWAKDTPINVDLPTSACETIKAILNDDKAVAEINNGVVGIEFSLYTSKKFNRPNCTAFHFCEITPF